MYKNRYSGKTITRCIMIIVLHNIISIIKICIFTMFFRYEKEALPRIDELENADAKLKMRLKGIKTISI